MQYTCVKLCQIKTRSCGSKQGAKIKSVCHLLDIYIYTSLWMILAFFLYIFESIKLYEDNLLKL